MLSRFCACLCAFLVLVLTGCTITSEGIQQAEVPMEEVFPPSKVVSSYCQAKKPVKMAGADLSAQFGGGTKVAILHKWGHLNTLYADYGIPGRPLKARLSVTELATKHDAYGAYTNLRPALLDEGDYVKIGVHGVLDSNRLLFVQDRFLIVVRDLSGDDGPARRALLFSFGQEISMRIPRDITDIKLVNCLPYENRVAGTERLDKEDPLNLGFLKSGGVTALYRLEDREGKVFVAEPPDSTLTGHLMKEVRKAFEKEGPVTELGIGEEGMQGKLYKLRAMAARREKLIFGCYGTLTEQEMRNLMAGIDGRLRPPPPPPKKRDREKEKEEEDREKKMQGL